MFALLAISLGALSPAIFLGRIPAQVDWCKVFGPWSPHPQEIHNPGGGDDFFVYLPDRLAALHEWRQGHLPLWNPYISGGTSFLGMQTANPLDPFVLLELLLPTGYALGISYAALLFLAGLGVLLYLRDQGLERSFGLCVAAVSFALNPYFISWLENRVFVAGLATLPLALWSMERIILRPNIRRNMTLLALMIAVAALGGTLQTLALLLMVLMVRLAWILLLKHGPDHHRRLVWVGLGIAAGLTVAALPIVAGIELLSKSLRLTHSGYYANDNFLHWRALALWFSSEVFGSPARGDFAAGILGRRLMSGSGWGAMGVVPLGLAAFALVRRAGPARERVFWGALAGGTVVFLLLQDTPVNEILLRVVPWIQDVDLLRGLVVVNLAGALLAGWGASKLEEVWTRGEDRRGWLVFWILFLIVGTGMVVMGRLGIEPAHGLTRDLLPLLVPVLAVMGVGVFSNGRPARARWGLWFLILVIGLELGRVHFGLNTFAKSELAYPPHPAIRDLQERLASPDHPRFLVEGQFRVFPPNTGSIFQLSDVRGYSNVPISRFRLLIECAEKTRKLNNLTILNQVDSPIYALLGAEYLLSAGEVSKANFDRVPGLWKTGFYRRLRFFPRAFLVHELMPIRNESDMRSVLSDPAFDPARAPLEGAPGEMPSVEPGRGVEDLTIRSMTSDTIMLRARASSSAVLVLTDAYYPGWKATLDGVTVRIYPVYWGLRGVLVPKGEHEVVFSYRPAWLMPVAIVSVITLFCLLAALFI
jgi:membrane protein YfhO